jgi:peptidoglycan/LPS O-acetylase OafA/YrhL
MILLAPTLRILLHTPAALEIYSFWCRMDGLAYGSAIALLVSFRRSHPEHWFSSDRLINWLTWILPPISLAFWIISGPTPYKVLSSSLGITLADISVALITLTFIRQSGSNKIWVSFFRNKPLRSIGKVSYTMYLCHYPLLRLANDYMQRFHLEHRIQVVLTHIVALLLTFSVSYSMWYLVESRILHWKDRIVPSPHPNQANTAITLDAHTN